MLDLLLGQLFKRRCMTASGIGEQYIELTVCLLDRFGHAQHVTLARGVSVDSKRTCAKLVHCGVEHVLSPTGDVNYRTVLNEALRGAEAEAGCPAGDERNTPFQCLCVHGFPSEDSVDA
jgi:hypothetical protein